MIKGTTITTDAVLSLVRSLGINAEPWTLDIREYTLESGVTLEDVPAVHLLECPVCNAGFDDLFVAVRGTDTPFGARAIVVATECGDDATEYEPMCGLCETLEELESTLREICGEHRSGPHGPARSGDD
jgi:hypothetical protein